MTLPRRVKVDPLEADAKVSGKDPEIEGMLGVDAKDFIDVEERSSDTTVTEELAPAKFHPVVPDDPPKRIVRAYPVHPGSIASLNNTLNVLITHNDHPQQLIDELHAELTDLAKRFPEDTYSPFILETPKGAKLNRLWKELTRTSQEHSTPNRPPSQPILRSPDISPLSPLTLEVDFNDVSSILEGYKENDDEESVDAEELIEATPNEDVACKELQDNGSIYQPVITTEDLILKGIKPMSKDAIRPPMKPKVATVLPNMTVTPLRLSSTAVPPFATQIARRTSFKKRSRESPEDKLSGLEVRRLLTEGLFDGESMMTMDDPTL